MDRPRRRLTVIAALDVVGYSHLMQGDELRTLSELGTIYKGIARPTLAKFGGAGDWMQTVFQGVLNVTPQITWLQLVMWAAYLVPVMFLFLRDPSTPKPAPAKATEPAATS